jgi:hypothetical protein
MVADLDLNAYAWGWALGSPGDGWEIERGYREIERGYREIERGY